MGCLNKGVVQKNSPIEGIKVCVYVCSTESSQVQPLWLQEAKHHIFTSKPYILSRVKHSWLESIAHSLSYETLERPLKSFRKSK